METSRDITALSISMRESASLELKEEAFRAILSQSVGLKGGQRMARISGVEPAQAGLFTRLVYWMVRRRIRQLTGRAALVEPIKVLAHHPRLLKATGQMEMGQAAARSVPEVLKSLASLQAARMIGCPF
jgi:hypothetical protein